jgi:hypothetical protein
MNKCRGRKCETEPLELSLWMSIQIYVCHCSATEHKHPLHINYDTTFTSLGEDDTGSSVVLSSLLASLVACLIASLYGPRFFLLYLVCKMVIYSYSMAERRDCNKICCQHLQHQTKRPQLANSLFNVCPWFLVSALYTSSLIWESVCQHAVNVTNFPW